MLSFTLNGRLIDLPEAAFQLTLLDFVRGTGLTGTKEGCAEGECGACAVLFLVREHDGRAAWRAINSCLVPLTAVAGHEVYTIEGVAQAGALADVEEALTVTGGSQCGYCTPGFAVSLVAEQHRPGRVGACDPLALGGNLCRCTGYRPIRDAALSLGVPPSSPLLDRLSHDVDPPAAIVLDAFARPESVERCVALLASRPDACVVAGSTDLGVESVRRRLGSRPLVSLDAIEELRRFSIAADAVAIGAALPLTDLGILWTSAPPAVREWLVRFGSPLVRNRATLGGNLATSSPIGDAAPLLMALDAAVELAGPAGRRSVSVADFFTGYRRTVLGPAELIVSIRIPQPLPPVLAFYKVAKRHLDDISTVAAAFSIDPDAEGKVMRSRFCFGGVAATPVRVRAVEEVVDGRPWDEAPAAAVDDVLRRMLTPMSDHRGSREYRLALTGSLVRKFFAERSR